MRRSPPPTSSIRRCACRTAPRSRSPTGSTAPSWRPTATSATAPPRSSSTTSCSKRSVNTYASLYNGVLQRDWFHAQSRGYRSTLDAALHGNNIPTTVVENLIATTKAGTEPLRRYHRLRKRVLGLETYHTYDTTIPLVEIEAKYPYEDVLEWLPESVAPLGADYQRQLREALNSGWIDVYENPGKRSGAYSAPVYGVHPYMLLNHNDTLDAVFTLAHEAGHSMHTLLSHAHQPFVYSDYTIFIAEVPSTLSEALFLEYMLAHADERARADRAAAARHRRDRRHFLHASDVCRLRAAGASARRSRPAGDGRPAQRDLFQPVQDVSRRRARLRRPVAGDVGADPAFLQHAVLRLSVRHLLRLERAADEAADRARPERRSAAAIDRYLTLLKSGGSDHPMALLQRAGVDLSRPETVRAVVDQLDALVTRLEGEINSQGTSLKSQV